MPDDVKSSGVFLHNIMIRRPYPDMLLCVKSMNLWIKFFNRWQENN